MASTLREYAQQHRFTSIIAKDITAKRPFLEASFAILSDTSLDICLAQTFDVVPITLVEIIDVKFINE